MQYNYYYNSIIKTGRDIDKATNISIFYNDIWDDIKSDILTNFKHTKYHERISIKNMKEGSTKIVYFNKDSSTLKDFLSVIYQIRCNLFHGDKDCQSSDEQKLVKWAYESFSKLINKHNEKVVKNE
jgi:hypothetical protein